MDTVTLIKRYGHDFLDDGAKEKALIILSEKSEEVTFPDSFVQDVIKYGQVELFRDSVRHYSDFRKLGGKSSSDVLLVPAYLGRFKSNVKIPVIKVISLWE